MYANMVPATYTQHRDLVPAGSAAYTQYLNSSSGGRLGIRLAQQQKQLSL